MRRAPTRREQRGQRHTLGLVAVVCHGAFADDQMTIVIGAEGSALYLVPVMLCR